jgi:predicted aspartyl protease
MIKLAVGAIMLFVVSCAPRFTVYLNEHDKMNTNGVIVLSVNKLDARWDKQKKITYVLTRDLGRISKAVCERKQKKIKEEVDKLAR